MCVDSVRGLLDMVSYPAIGYRWRSRYWAAIRTDLRGKVCVVTGGSEGIGYGIAEGLAATGATVVIVCLDPHVGEAACGALGAHLEVGDLSSMEAVRNVAARIGARFGRVDVLVNNVGCVFRTRRQSADGVELTFATNVLSGFAMTRALRPWLLAAVPARVVHVGSSAQYLCRVDMVELLGQGRCYSADAAYGRSKRAVEELSLRWAEQLGPQGITSNCMHPGLTLTPGVARTYPLYRRVMGPWLRTRAEGADTAVWLGASQAAARENAGFWFDRRRQPEHLFSWTRATRGEVDRLWSECERLSS
ncbi:MAG TPA: SDR family NAD(P)-dependent oxidoreductase [Candidatus Xenobia bacterium]